MSWSKDNVRVRFMVRFSPRVSLVSANLSINVMSEASSVSILGLGVC